MAYRDVPQPVTHRSLRDRKREELIADTLTVMPHHVQRTLYGLLQARTLTTNETRGDEERESVTRQNGGNAKRSCVEKSCLFFPAGEARSFRSLFRLLSSFAFPAMLPSRPCGAARRFVS